MRHCVRVCRVHSGQLRQLSGGNECERTVSPPSMKRQFVPTIAKYLRMRTLPSSSPVQMSVLSLLPPSHHNVDGFVPSQSV